MKGPSQPSRHVLVTLQSYKDAACMCHHGTLHGHTSIEWHTMARVSGKTIHGMRQLQNSCWKRANHTLACSALAGCNHICTSCQWLLNPAPFCTSTTTSHTFTSTRQINATVHELTQPGVGTAHKPSREGCSMYRVLCIRRHCTPHLNKPQVSFLQLPSRQANQPGSGLHTTLNTAPCAPVTLSTTYSTSSCQTLPQ